MMENKSVCEQVQEGKLEKGYEQMDLGEKLNLQSCAIGEFPIEMNEKYAEEVNNKLVRVEKLFFKEELKKFVLESLLEKTKAIVSQPDTGIIEEDYKKYKQVDDLCMECFNIDTHKILNLYKLYIE